MQRRDFLTLCALTPLLGRTPHVLAAAHADGVLLSAASDAAGRHYLVGLNADGTRRFQTPLPGRAHAVVAHPNGRQALAVARRPGRFIAVVDLADGRIAHTIESAPDRHFYGHAAFSADGTRLFTTENDYATGAGRLGVRHVDAGYTPIAEWSSAGIGPHELLRDEALVVANGGLRTHPDQGRRTLNADAIEPSLAWLAPDDGRVLARHEPDEAWRRASIRHIAALPGRRIAIAMQYQGDSRGEAPLVAIGHPEQGLRPLYAPTEIQRGLRDYCGSVTVDAAGETFAVSAPRGNRVLFWQADGEYLGALRVQDGCGLAAAGDAGGFLISDGLGGLRHHDARTQRTDTLRTDTALHFDNHLTAL